MFVFYTVLESLKIYSSICNKINCYPILKAKNKIYFGNNYLSDLRLNYYALTEIPISKRYKF